MTKLVTQSYIHNQHTHIRAYLGGSFNPVHIGHLQMAQHVYDTLIKHPVTISDQIHIQVSLLPTARSPFKDTTIAPIHRLKMLELATKHTPLDICELEIWQEPPVFTIHTVRQLRTLYPNDVLIFIIGQDSFESLAKWKDGLSLINHVNFWVFPRKTTAHYPSASLPNDILPLKPHLTDDIATLISQPFGHIYQDTHIIPAISSSSIRHLFMTYSAIQDKEPNKIVTPLPSNFLPNLLPSLVFEYIQAHHLYSKST